MTDKEIKDSLYIGYIPLNGKKPLIKDWGKDYFGSFEEANNFNGADGVGGVLRTDIIYLDVDSHKEETKAEDLNNIEKIMGIIKGERLSCIARKTNTGLHVFFSDTSNRIERNTKDTSLSCGLHAEIKTGLSNSFDILVCEEKERSIIYENGISDIPSFFLPINRTPVMVDLREGDGRNETLFSYICNLHRNGFSKEEVRKTLQIINDYVFYSPLPRKELDQITRDGAFPKEYFLDEKKKFSHDLFARYLVNELSIVLHNEVPYMFNGKCYSAKKRDIEREMVKRIPSLNHHMREEIYRHIILIADTVNSIENGYICFLNGLFNIRTGNMEKHTHEKFITNCIPHNYNPSAESPRMDKALSEWCNYDEDTRKALEEATGICLSSTTELQKMFILYGEKANGKSTFLEALIQSLGEENVSNLDIYELGERFSVTSVFNMLANVGDDISDAPINSNTVAIVKKMVTGGRTKGEYKGEKIFFFNPYASYIFSANTMPTIKDETGAFARRVIVIPFDHYFDTDRELSLNFQEEDYEYLIKVGVTGLLRVIMNNSSITHSNRMLHLRDELLTHIDSIRSFVDSFERKDSSFAMMIVDEAYRKYKSFCNDLSVIGLSKKSFIKYMDDYFGFKVDPRKVNGKSYRVFIRK